MKGWTKRIAKALQSANEAVQGGLQDSFAELDLWAVNHVNDALEKFSEGTKERFDQAAAGFQKQAKHKAKQAGTGAKQQLQRTGKKLQRLARSAWQNLGK